MQLMREKMSARVTREREHELWTRLGEQFQPLVVDVSLGLRRALQLPVVDVSRGGELFRAGESDLLYYWIPEDRRSVEIGAIFGELPPQKAYDEFRQTIAEALGSTRWTRVSPVTERSQQLQEETETFPQGSADLESAKVLANPLHRRLLLEAARRPGVTVEAVVGPDKELDWEGGVEALERNGLVQREFQVFCRDTGIQLCKFASKAALVEAAQMGFRSFSSGRPINEERLVQFLFITDRGRWLARRNLWLALALADHLRSLGVPSAQLRWTYERDYRTVTLFTSYQQAICLFEVQEDAVTADQAFRFFSRVRYYQPDAAFLVCPAGLRQDSRLVVQNLSHGLETTRVRLIQDLGALENQLLDVVAAVTRRGVDQLLQRFESLTRVSVGQAVGEHLLGPEPIVVEKEEPSISDEATISANSASEGQASPAPTNDSLLDLDLDIDLSDLDLEPSRPSSSSTTSSAMDDFDLDLDLDSFDFSTPSKPTPAVTSAPPVAERSSTEPPLPTPQPVSAQSPAELAAQIDDFLNEEDLPAQPPPAPPAPPVAVPPAAPVAIPPELAVDASIDLGVDMDWLAEVADSIEARPEPIAATPEPIAPPEPIHEEPPVAPEPLAVVQPPVAPEPVVEYVPVAPTPVAEVVVAPTPVAEVAVAAPVAEPAYAQMAPPSLPESSSLDLPDFDDLDLDFKLDLDLDLPPMPGTPAPTPAAPPTPVPAAAAPEEFPHEVLPEFNVPMTEKSPEEKLDYSLRRVLDEVQRKGLACEVEDYLNDFRDVSGCSAVLSTTEGLAFQGRLQDPQLSEQVTALQPEIWELCHRALQEADLGKLASLVVEGGSGRMQVVPAWEDIWLTVYEQLATRHEEPAALLPGEMTLREAILKKVLEDLGQLDAIEGNLVISRDGLPIETQLPDPNQADSLGVAVTQLLGDADQLFALLGLTPIRQVNLKTTERMFSLIPLDQETVLITILKPDASRDIWQARLQGAATMLASVFQ